MSFLHKQVLDSVTSTANEVTCTYGTWWNLLSVLVIRPEKWVRPWCFSIVSKKMPNIRHSIVCFHLWWRQTYIEILWEWGPPPLTLQGKFGHPPWSPCRIDFLGPIQPWVPELRGGGQVMFKIIFTPVYQLTTELMKYEEEGGSPLIEICTSWGEITHF